ncbi:InlB B-repeat-containing protein [Enorma sp.]|uniref:InlB B-repeat-containing protein n=1 Tax=Enorma sp. TaxID=1920692 RepID=UPI003AB39D03
MDVVRRTLKPFVAAVFISVAAMLVVLAPRMAYAAEVEVDSFEELVNAVKIASADDPSTITLAGNITATDNLSLGANRTVVLDLNGCTLDMADHSIRMGISSALEIQDSSPNGGGTISGTGSYTIQTRTGRNSKITVKSGSVSNSTGAAVGMTTTGAEFKMTGGTLSAPVPLSLQLNATASITGGTLVSTDGGVAVDMTQGSPQGACGLTIGVAGDYDTPVLRGNVKAYTGVATLELLGGTIQGVEGELPSGATLTSRFESDVATVLPANMQCIERDGAWYVTSLDSEAAAGAKIVKSDGSIEYYQLASTALGALSDGDTLTLYEDANAQISVGGFAATIDLNGRTVTSDADAVVSLAGSGADLTIMNGAIVSTSTSENAVIIMVADKDGMDGANLTLENVDLTMQNSGGAGIQVYGLNTKNAVTLDGCTITVPDDVMGVYFPAADSTLTVRDTQITAGTGIGIKGGSLVMSGDSVIHAKGENDPAGIPSTGGIAETGAAIYVDGGYKDRTVNVEIQGGTYTSDKGSALQELVDPARPDATPVTVEVSSGAFSDASIKGYLVGDAAVVVNEDGTCDVYPTEAEALANGGSYKVIDEDGHTWLFQNEQDAQDFNDGQGGVTKPIEQVTHTVTFDDCLKGTANASVEVPNGQGVSKPQDPECAGYRFLGWYELVNGAYASEPYDFTSAVTADLTLYAKWERVAGRPSGGQPSGEPPASGTLEQTGDASTLATAAVAAAGVVTFVAGAVIGRKRK